MGDVVVPEGPDDAVTPLSKGYDHPSSLLKLLASGDARSAWRLRRRELTGWLADAGFRAAVTWQWKDIAVFSCDPR